MGQLYVRIDWLNFTYQKFLHYKCALIFNPIPVFEINFKNKIKTIETKITCIDQNG